MCVTGAVITLGKAQKFRFNHPAEAAALRQERLKVGVTVISEWLVGTALLGSALPCWDHCSFPCLRLERFLAAVALWNGWIWMEMSVPQDWVSVLCSGRRGENLLFVAMESPMFASYSRTEEKLRVLYNN